MPSYRIHGTLPASLRHMHPSEQEITSALTRYDFVVKILGQITDSIIEKNYEDNRWFIFSEKIATKYLKQAYTIQQLFNDENFSDKDGQETISFDFSSVYSLLRVQIETYSVFYHLFVDKCEMEEKIIRFRLWELDGLRTIDSYENPEKNLLSEKLAENKISITNCLSIIQEFKYFKNLDAKRQEFLLKYSNWKFTSESLRNNDKNKWKISINQMIMNTGLQESLFDSWYSFTSTHAHTSYWSVVQNDSLTREERITMKYVAIMQAVFVTSFMIKDFCGIYEVARKEFETLSINEQDVINSFDRGGRK